MNKFILCTSFLIIAFGQIKIEQTIKPELPNSNSKFNSIVVSNLDEIYITDETNNEILSFDFSGKFTNKIGGYGWDENSLNYPIDISINTGLNIVVADKNNHRLVRYDKNLNFISTLPDDNSFLELSYPKVCKISKDGTMFILQENNYEILKLEFDYESYSYIGNNVDKEFQLVEPIDLYITKNQNLLILERSGKILKYDFFGTPIKIISLSSENFKPNNILSINNNIFALTEAGKIYQLINQSWQQLLTENTEKFVDFCNDNGQLYLLSENGNIYICQFQD